jgi:nitrogen regulatory protein P-II 1
VPGQEHPLLHLIVIVKPFRVEAVLEALSPIASALSVQEVRGYGRQKGHLDAYHGDEIGLDFIPKARIEFDIEDLFYDEAVTAIVRAARTGRIGDGKIFVIRALDFVASPGV